MKTSITIGNFDYQWSEEDIVNEGDMIPYGEFNPHSVRPFILHDAGFVIAVVFSASLQDAIDEAVDHGKLDRFQIQEADYGDYAINSENPTCDFLGNASEPFDIESLGVVHLEAKDWTCEYWTEEFLLEKIAYLLSDLGLNPITPDRSGRTEEYVKSAMNTLQTLILERDGRK